MFGIKQKKYGANFFDLPAREQVKIIRKATRGANQEQRELVKEYERKSDRHFKFGKCSL
jgi:TRAP-type C4-dicarboxylate transport system substrate-binding protein